jgi:hypothetical protein
VEAPVDDLRVLATELDSALNIPLAGHGDGAKGSVRSALGQLADDALELLGNSLELNLLEDISVVNEAQLGFAVLKATLHDERVVEEALDTVVHASRSASRSGEEDRIGVSEVVTKTHVLEGLDDSQSREIAGLLGALSELVDVVDAVLLELDHLS